MFTRDQIILVQKVLIKKGLYFLFNGEDKPNGRWDKRLQSGYDGYILRFVDRNDRNNPVYIGVQPPDFKALPKEMLAEIAEMENKPVEKPKITTKPKVESTVEGPVVGNVIEQAVESTEVTEEQNPTE